MKIIYAISVKEVIQMKRKRRLRKAEVKKRTKMIVIGIISLICVLSVGYAAFQTTLNINVSGTAKRTDYYVSNSGSDENGDGTLDNPYLTIQKAYNEAGKVATIYIMNDISQSTTINMDKEKKITLTSYSTNNIVHSVIKTTAINGGMINLKKGTLTISNISLDGNNIEDSASGIYISNNAQLNANEKSLIHNFLAPSKYGGGIYNSGFLNIDGGVISGNEAVEGGGIYCYSGSVLLKNGIIANNKAKNAGGIYVYQESILTIEGGTITNNTASNQGGGIVSWTSTSDTPTINMLGGEISSNTAKESGGIHLPSGTFNMSGGIIKNNTATSHSGGIHPHGTGVLDYIAGIICENTPTNEYETHDVCPN